MAFAVLAVPAYADQRVLPDIFVRPQAKQAPSNNVQNAQGYVQPRTTGQGIASYSATQAYMAQQQQQRAQQQQYQQPNYQPAYGQDYVPVAQAPNIQNPPLRYRGYDDNAAPLLATEPSVSSTNAAQGTDPLAGGGNSSSSSSNTNSSPQNTGDSLPVAPGGGGNTSNSNYAAPAPTFATPTLESSSSSSYSPIADVPTPPAQPSSPAPSTATPSTLPDASSSLANSTNALGGSPSANSFAPPPPATNMPPVDTPATADAFPPISDTSLQNNVRNEAESAFYERRRKRLADTFERAYEGLVPLGPNEVRDVMGRYERTQRSAVAPSTGQPRGQVRIKTLSLEPGSEPPTVNVAAGYVTTIAIVDATGQPWPILDIGIGGNFEVSKTGGGNGATHVVRLMPLTRFGYGNLSVLLQDLPTPIIFKLASGGTSVDYRFDGRIPKLGPNAKLSLIERRNLQAGSALIMTFLDNAPPPDAKRVKVSGADARTLAWLVNDRMFVRTPLTMLSPSWDASVSSADGTTVYELKETPSLLMSDNGTLIRARVAPKEEE
jgi:intracellular multiplication protein IcmK